MTVKILFSGVFHSLSETAIELENNSIFKHTIQLSIFINLGHPHIRKKCLCMLAKNSFCSYLYFILHAHATYSWHNIVLFNNRNTWIVVSCTNANCKETMVRKDLDEHVTVTCQWRMIHCSYCSVPIAKYYEEVSSRRIK